MNQHTFSAYFYSLRKVQVRYVIDMQLVKCYFFLIIIITISSSIQSCGDVQLGVGRGGFSKGIELACDGRVILILDLVSPECSPCSQIITNTHVIPKTPDLDW